jgi:uncharacterized membrane protein YkvA (DUF1232 family)
LPGGPFITILSRGDLRERIMRFARAAMSENEQYQRDEATVLRDFWAKFGKFAAQLPFAEDLLTAYYCAFDRETPTHVRVALIGALAYFISPFDVLPDLLPIIGFTDDAAVLAAAFKLVWDNIKPAHRDAARQTLVRLNAGGGA